jgi:hypothetical protein
MGPLVIMNTNNILKFIIVSLHLLIFKSRVCEKTTIPKTRMIKIRVN